MHSLRSQRRPALTDDGGLLTTVVVKEQTVDPLRVWSEGERWPRTTHIGGQRPHDGVVASEAITVIVVVNDGDFHGHAVEVNHAVDHTGRLSCCNTWEMITFLRKCLF